MEFITKININHCAEELNVSVNDIKIAVAHVGRSFNDVTEYLENYHNCGVNLKLSNFKVKGTAFLIEEKNAEIKSLERDIRDYKIIIDALNQKIEKLENSNPEVKFPFIREYTTDKYTQYQVIYEKGGIVSTCCFRDKKDEAIAFLEYLKDTQKE